MVIASMLPGTGITELSINPSRISPGPPSVKNQCLTTCAVVGGATANLPSLNFIATPPPPPSHPTQPSVTKTLPPSPWFPTDSGPAPNPILPRGHLNSYGTSSNCVPGKVRLVVVAYNWTWVLCLWSYATRSEPAQVSAPCISDTRTT